MPINLLHRHVLEDHISGFETNANPNHLSVIRRPVIFSVLAHACYEAAVAEALHNADDIASRYCSPSEFLAVSQTRGAGSVAEFLTAIPGASFVNQSDGFVLMAISGPSVRSILSKCVAVDLHPDTFGEGHSAAMMCCHVTAIVARTGRNTFELLVPRSFAGSVFDELMEAGSAHALTRGFAD